MACAAVKTTVHGSGRARGQRERASAACDWEGARAGFRRFEPRAVCIDLLTHYSHPRASRALGDVYLPRWIRRAG